MSASEQDTGPPRAAAEAGPRVGESGPPAPRVGVRAQVRRPVRGTLSIPRQVFCHSCDCSVTARVEWTGSLTCSACTSEFVERPPTVHHGAVCSACEVTPISGIRWRCRDCPNVDLCPDCYKEREGVHFPGHRFTPIHDRQPTAIHLSRFDFVIPIPQVDMDDRRSGLRDEDVAWWLSAEKRQVVEVPESWACAVCTDGQNDDRMVDAGCHVYHESCLRGWLVRKNNCPVCRRSPIVPHDWRDE